VHSTPGSNHMSSATLERRDELEFICRQVLEHLLLPA
jgi:hypothetical protein